MSACRWNYGSPCDADPTHLLAFAKRCACPSDTPLAVCEGHAVEIHQYQRDYFCAACLAACSPIEPVRIKVTHHERPLSALWASCQVRQGGDTGMCVWACAVHLPLWHPCT